MEKNRTVESAWAIYAELHDTLNNITIGLEHTIEVCDLIANKRREGIQVDYFNGNPPESAVRIRCAEPPQPYDHVEHELTLAIELMRDQYIPAVWGNLPPARKAMDDVPASLQNDLDESAGGRDWKIHTRRTLNDLATSPSPYRGFLSPPPTEAGFPRNVSDAIHVCNNGLSRDAWRRHREQLQERLKQLCACWPPQSEAGNAGQQNTEAAGDAPEPDGPCGILQWRHASVILSAKMTAKPYALAVYLYERIGRPVRFGDLVGVGRLWENAIGDETVAKHGQAVARYFLDNNVPLIVSSGSGTIWMEEIRQTKN